jgi:hypothetical protein
MGFCSRRAYNIENMVDIKNLKNFIMWQFVDRKISTGCHFQNGRHNTAKILHCSISKVAFDLFFKPVVSGRFGRHSFYFCL